VGKLRKTGQRTLKNVALNSRYTLPVRVLGDVKSASQMLLHFFCCSNNPAVRTYSRLVVWGHTQKTKFETSLAPTGPVCFLDRTTLNWFLLRISWNGLVKVLDRTRDQTFAYPTVQCMLYDILHTSQLLFVRCLNISVPVVFLLYLISRYSHQTCCQKLKISRKRYGVYTNNKKNWKSSWLVKYNFF